uniref:Zinc finger protein 428 n=1 Tax=Molossus molossus TaxID=27622 RepID=A0A7J8CCM1_MOLMO|nr:zinc finger protein 428 [Molossus molossus]
MTETREPAETGGYASLEEDEEDLSPGPEHSSDSEYTLSEPDSEEEEDEEEEEEETTDDPEYDPGYKGAWGGRGRATSGWGGPAHWEGGGRGRGGG